MADDGEDRTEEATPRRREDARQQGRVATSSEFTGSVVLLAGVIGLLVMGKSIGEGMLDVFRTDLSRLMYDNFDSTQTRMMLYRIFERGILFLGAFFGLLLATGVAVSIVQVGFHITTERLEPDFDRLNPANGLKRLFSLPAVVKGLTGILKVIVIGVIAYIVVRNRFGTITTLGEDSFLSAVGSAWDTTIKLALYLASLLAIIGAADYFYQRFQFETSIRMTKQEVKEEMKREQGDPEIKNRMRQLARERVRRKMLAEVPKSTVIITNPTRYAVALQYDAGSNGAPRVIVKGRGREAMRIIEMARRHSVPVLERPLVARALFKSVQEGHEIPTPFFTVVAEIIAFVFRLRGIGP